MRFPDVSQLVLVKIFLVISMFPSRSKEFGTIPPKVVSCFCKGLFVIQQWMSTDMKRGCRNSSYTFSPSSLSVCINYVVYISYTYTINSHTCGWGGAFEGLAAGPCRTLFPQWPLVIFKKRGIFFVKSSQKNHFEGLYDMVVLHPYSCPLFE